jgi:hypothetical protein
MSENKIQILPNHDVLTYRIGYYNFMKLNFEYMIKKVVTKQWYLVDILLEWGNGSEEQIDKQ